MKGASISKAEQVIGADGTNTNVGRDKGAIPYLEELLGHSVHWNICLLHGNELPFRALFAHYDGKTAGPSSFKGPLGKELETVLTQRRVVDFAPIPNNDFPQLPDDVRADLSHDQ